MAEEKKPEIPDFVLPGPEGDFYEFEDDLLDDYDDNAWDEFPEEEDWEDEEEVMIMNGG